MIKFAVNHSSGDKFRILNNIADELQLIENLSPDGFFQKSFLLINNTYDDSIDRDLPAVI